MSSATGEGILLHDSCQPQTAQTRRSPAIILGPTADAPSRGTPLYCFIAFRASAFRSKCTSAVPKLRPERS